MYKNEKRQRTGISPIDEPSSSLLVQTQTNTINGTAPVFLLQNGNHLSEPLEDLQDTKTFPLSQSSTNSLGIGSHTSESENGIDDSDQTFHNSLSILQVPEEQELYNMTNCSPVQMEISSYPDCRNHIEKYAKIFNDPIHGLIKLHPACLAIIDTQQFQRLRYIKQLGMCYYVYPGASHNRFEHSLGVCHLAGQYARILQKNQPNLGITDKDILCVEIAGLCHDLGHGPFSHLFDGKFIPVVFPEKKWKHEKGSLDMLDFLIAENKLMEPSGILYKYGLDERDILFIKEQIYGPLDKTIAKKGRDVNKYFLYEIVSNKRNGIDVDKWDYFARDCHHLGVKNNFDHSRFMKFARVIQVNGEWQICTRDKEIGNLYNMFYTRYTLHRTAYQHKVSNAIETMVVHALIKANPYLLFDRKDGSKCRMSECIDDMHAYTQLTDNVLFKLLYSDIQAQDLQEAKNIIQRVFARDLYTCIYESVPLEATHFYVTADDILKDVFKKAEESSGVSYAQGDAVVQITYLDFGMKHQNPVEKLLVYSKHEGDTARHLPKSEASRILGPMTFSELLIRVYSCSRDKTKCDILRRAAKCWFEEMQRGWDQTMTTPEKKRTEELSPLLQLTPSSAGKHMTRYSNFEME